MEAEADAGRLSAPTKRAMTKQGRWCRTGPGRDRCRKLSCSHATVSCGGGSALIVGRAGHRAGSVEAVLK